MGKTRAIGAKRTWWLVGIVASAVAWGCGNDSADHRGPGTTGETGANAGASQAGSGDRAGASSPGGSAGSGAGGASGGGAPFAGAGGSGSGSPLQRAVCRQDANKLCTDSLEKSKADFDAACVDDGHGAVATRCPSEGLIGCCFIPGAMEDGIILYGDTSYCFYEGDVDGLREDTCRDVGGAWSKTPPA